MRVQSLETEPILSEDVQLISEALAGRSDAFGKLVLKYQDRLFNTVAHMLGQSEDARDVVQEAFVRAFVKLDSFNRRSEFYTWLYRIAMNAASTHRRRRRPVGSIEQNRETLGEEPADGGDGPTARLEQEERAERIRAALARLPDEFREILVLREIDGCDYESLAEMLDVPIGTVRSRLHRARLQMKEEISKLQI